MASPVAYLVRRGHLRTRHLLLISLALGGCRSRAPAAPPSQPPAKQAVSRAAAGAARTAGVAIRIPTKGGAPRVYRLPTLVEIPTAIRGKLPPVTRVIGLDAEAEFLYVTTRTKDTTATKKGARVKKDTSTTTPKSDVLALDLGSARVDTVASGIEQATLGPDGTLYTVDAKRRVVTLARRVRVAWPQPLPGVPLQLFGAADQRLVVADAPALITAAADQPPTTRPLPAGSDVAATRWGDLVGVAADSGVVLMDPLGRRLLAKPAAGDSVFVVDLPVKRLVGTLASAWRTDLPAIAPDGALLVRQGDDVVAYRPDSLAATGRVKGGGVDLWMLTGWRPRGAYRGAFGDAGAQPDQGAASDTAGPEGPMYVQVSTSQNEAWSSEMAQQLTRAGLAARVLQPRNPDDGYRVVLGPYPTRAQAEGIGRKLGRPFWIYQPTP